MKIDYRWPDEIDPSDVEGIADSVDDAVVFMARRGGYDWAGKTFERRQAPAFAG